MRDREEMPAVNTRIASVIAKVNTAEFQSLLHEQTQAEKINLTPEEKEARRKYMREYQQKPRFKAYMKAYRKTPKYKVRMRDRCRLQAAADRLGIPLLLYSAMKVIHEFGAINDE